MTLYQGRPATSTRHGGRRCGLSMLGSTRRGGTGAAVTQVHRYLATLDADDQQARNLVASWDLPEHFATRGVSYHKNCITEHHFLSNFGGLKRLLGLTPAWTSWPTRTAPSCGSRSGTRATRSSASSLSTGCPVCHAAAGPATGCPRSRITSSSCTARQPKSSASAQPPTAMCRLAGTAPRALSTAVRTTSCTGRRAPWRPAGPSRMRSSPSWPRSSSTARPTPGIPGGKPARQLCRPGLPAVRKAAHRRGAAGDGGPGP